MMPSTLTESPTLEAAEPQPLATPIRWLLVIPAAFGGALAMAVIAVLTGVAWASTTARTEGEAAK